jgi:hypothetical protein
MQLNIKDASGLNVLFIEILDQEKDAKGWLEATCNFSYQHFNAHFKFSSIVNDFYPFLEQLQILKENLKGQAEYSNIEGNVTLVFVGDGLGHVSVRGELRHSTNPFLTTTFEIETDQTFLPGLIKECKEIMEQFEMQ